MEVKSIKINYKRFADKYDEWIDCVREKERIKEVGSLSGAHGFAKESTKI